MDKDNDDRSLADRVREALGRDEATRLETAMLTHNTTSDPAELPPGTGVLEGTGGDNGEVPPED